MIMRKRAFLLFTTMFILSMAGLGNTGVVVVVVGFGDDYVDSITFRAMWFDQGFLSKF